MDAIILLNKPAGMTSFAAAAAVRKAVGERKAGHTGTLDPNASGLMIILLGRYTKLAPYCVSNRKHYLAEFIMGKAYDTEDIWGTVTDEKDPSVYDDAVLAEVSARMTGEQEQVPPMYSAVKVNGRKLYQMARQGKTVERAARHITVDRLEVTHVTDNTYRMDAVVSSGTYIRTLIADYAAQLGEYAAMSRLERTGIEHLRLADADTLDDVRAGVFRSMSPYDVIDPVYPRVEFHDPALIRSGRAVRLSCTDPVVMIVHERELLAAYERRDDGLYHCLRGLF